MQGRNYRQFGGSGFGKEAIIGNFLAVVLVRLAQCKHAAIGNFLAVVLVSPVQGRSYRQFSGSGFGKPSARTQLTVCLLAVVAGSGSGSR